MFTIIRVVLEPFLFGSVSFLSWLGVIKYYFYTDFYITNVVDSTKLDTLHWRFRAFLFISLGVHARLYYLKSTGNHPAMAYQHHFLHGCGQRCRSDFSGNVQVQKCHDNDKLPYDPPVCHYYGASSLRSWGLGFCGRFLSVSAMGFLPKSKGHGVDMVCGSSWSYFSLPSQELASPIAYGPTPLTNAPHSARYKR